MVAERRRGSVYDAFVSVRLTHKYAETVDGVDLSAAKVGDYLRLSAREAALLVSEGWAVPCAPPASPPQVKGQIGHFLVAPGVSLPEHDRALCRWLQRPADQMAV
jgi:hypothetical protein